MERGGSTEKHHASQHRGVRYRSHGVQDVLRVKVSCVDSCSMWVWTARSDGRKLFFEFCPTR